MFWLTHDTVRIYNAHFESIHFSHEDVLFAEKVTSAQAENDEKFKDKSLRILRLMKKAFQKRAVQAEIVAQSYQDISLSCDFMHRSERHTYFVCLSSSKKRFDRYFY